MLRVQIIKMNLNQLTAISPIDGRYWSKVSTLSEYFSEFRQEQQKDVDLFKLLYSLFKHRIQVEIEYFILLCQCIEFRKKIEMKGMLMRGKERNKE